jgi:hypothetical protein
LTEQEIRYQAEMLIEFRRRGGDAKRWLGSKDFRKADREKILRLVQPSREASA